MQSRSTSASSRRGGKRQSRRASASTASAAELGALEKEARAEGTAVEGREDDLQDSIARAESELGEAVSLRTALQEQCASEVAEARARGDEREESSFV